MSMILLIIEIPLPLRGIPHVKGDKDSDDAAAKRLFLKFVIDKNKYLRMYQTSYLDFRPVHQ